MFTSFKGKSYLLVLKVFLAYTILAGKTYFLKHSVISLQVRLKTSGN